jgi:hypothetical protein
LSDKNSTLLATQRIRVPAGSILHKCSVNKSLVSGTRFIG